MRISKLATMINNTPRKLLSLLIGYHVWLIIGSWLPTTRWIEVPLCFYNVPSDCTVHAPELVNVALAGDRTALYHLDTTRLAVHIDTQRLASGAQTLNITRESLLLPNTIHVARHTPSNLVITVHQETKT